MTKTRPFASIGCALLISACLASAASSQTQPPEATEPAQPKLDRKACLDRDRLTLGDTHETQGNGPREPLSDRLARTDGVICPPPDIDPDMRVPAPGGGNTPVIPPPGSGDPTMRPK